MRRSFLVVSAAMPSIEIASAQRVRRASRNSLPLKSTRVSMVEIASSSSPSVTSMTLSKANRRLKMFFTPRASRLVVRTR